MPQPHSMEMSSEMLKEFKEFISNNPEVTAEVIESKTGTYLVLGEADPDVISGKEQYMILLTAERKQ